MITIKEKIKDLLLFDNNEIKITFSPNKINILNYDEIKNFDENKIIITYKDSKITIKGKNLITKKLMENEILIQGEIILIELG